MCNKVATESDLAVPGSLGRSVDDFWKVKTRLLRNAQDNFSGAELARLASGESVRQREREAKPLSCGVGRNQREEGIRSFMARFLTSSMQTSPHKEMHSSMAER